MTTVPGNYHSSYLPAEAAVHLMIMNTIMIIAMHTMLVSSTPACLVFSLLILRAV